MLATESDIIKRYNVLEATKLHDQLDIATMIINDYKLEHSITTDVELYALAYFVHDVISVI